MGNNTINCNTFTNIPLQCKNGIGGIKNAWVGAYSGFTFTEDVNSTVTGITEGATTLYELVPARTSSSVVEDQPIDNTNTIYKQTITLTFVDDYNGTIRNLVASLAKSTVVCVIQDRKDVFKIYGTENGLQVGTTHNSGTVESDKNSWTFKLEGTEAYNAPVVSASVMATYII